MMGPLTAQPVELASRAHTTQISETGVGSERIYNEPNSLNYTLTTPSLSADGRYIAFLSQQTNLVAGQTDANGRLDVFLRDLLTGATTLVSRSMSAPAATGNQGSAQAVISADGRFVAFISRATDLVPGQTGDGPSNSDQDLLLYDRVTGAASLVASSKSPPAYFANPALSADGRYIAFSSNAGDLVPGQRSNNINVFLHDRVEKTTRLVSHVSTSATTAGDTGSGAPSISSDGRYIAFTSSASNLVPGQGNAIANAFLFDRTSGALTLIGRGETAALSADGKFVAVLAPNEIYLYQRETRQTVSLGERRLRDYFSTDRPIVSISSDGRYTAFIGAPAASPNGLYVYDRIARTFTLASRRSGSTDEPGGAPDAPVISGDGRFVVFASPDPDLAPNQTDASGDHRTMDVFLFDRTSAATRLVSHASDEPTLTADGVSHAPTISANGTRLAFASMASNLDGDVKDHNEGLDVFVQDTASGNDSGNDSGNSETVSRRAPEAPSLSPDATSYASALSADGRFLAFESDSPYLVPGQVDSNGTTDVFLYDRQTRSTILVSRLGGSATATGNGPAILPVITPDGRYVGFASETSDSFPGGNGYDWDLFLFDRIAGTVTLVAPQAISNRPSRLPMQISPDGRWLAFGTQADLIAPGVRDENRTVDVYLLDRSTGAITLASHSNADPAVSGNHGSSSPLLSDDGRYVAFLSDATDLVPGQADPFVTLDLFLYDRETGKTVLVSRAADSPATAAQLRGSSFSMSADGRFLTFTRPDNTPRPSVLLYDRDPGTLLTIADGGLSPRISADGRFVTYVSVLNLEIPSQIHLYDRIAKSTSLVSRSSASSNGHATGYSDTPAISADGRYVAFASVATNLVAGQTSAPGRAGLDVFLFDRIAGRTVLASHAESSLTAAMGLSLNPPLISASGKQVAFTSFASLAANDLNHLPDAYLFDAGSASGPIPIPACTVLDTRRRADRPVLTSNVQRIIAASAFRGACGVPATAKQVRVNVTVFSPSGKGNLRFYPGAVTPTPSGILRFERNATRTETFTLPLSPGGTLTVLPFVSGKGTVHMAVEVTGYSN